MKKILFLTLVLALGISAFANNRVLTDYVDNDKIFDILKNDTIILQYFGSENQFKFVEPDTIWKKRVKRPKENKHYFLQWYQPIDQTNGIPLNTQTTISKQFIFQNIVLHVNLGKIELFLYDLESNRKIVFTPNRSTYITSNSIEDNILSLLKDSVIYYKPSLYVLEDEDKFYEKTSLKSVQHLISLFPYNTNYPMSVVCNLKFDNDITGYIRNDGVFLAEPIEAITKDEFLEHNALVQENMKQDSLVRLAKVFADYAWSDEQLYGFEGDTMAIIRYYKQTEYSWGGDSLDYFIAYAYGKEYSIEIESYKSIEDEIQFLDTNDLCYLKIRKDHGYFRRLESAKKWDQKNDSIIFMDCVKDTADVVWASLNYESSNILKHIDEYGDEKYEYVDKPSEGQRIPIFYYSSKGVVLGSFWTSYGGNFFAISPLHNSLTFENEADRLYLMRSGNRNFEARVKNAVIADIADRMVEVLEKELEKEKKIKNLIKRKIFLLSQDKAYGDYDWCGIKPKFLNCYNKTIKYIDCLVVPYNTFNDVQSDDYGRSSKEIRCVGPLEPGEIASWRFDEMFKNESGIIKTFRITNIKITFVDNSTVLYRGWENVKKHYEYVHDF